MKRFLLAAIVFCLSAAAHAQSYPNKPVKLLVGFAAGGPTDVIARILAQDMTQTLGQTVLVENKAGATSMIATQEVKRAPADGYTLYMTTLTHSVNAVLHADKKPYDPINDFTPISLVCHLPLVMVAKGDSPFNSAADVVKAAKAGDNAGVQAAQKRWSANGEEIATMLSEANPNWPKATLVDMMQKHLDLTTQEAVSRLKKDWDGDIAAYDKGHEHMLMFADALTDGIIKQFPSKFPKQVAKEKGTHPSPH